ncbi:hypothetical protein Btru_067891 [Bulinus truncatus]|nr:hypothetical protein Btru_067891 [Bulinus truncatus]
MLKEVVTGIAFILDIATIILIIISAIGVSEDFLSRLLPPLIVGIVATIFTICAFCLHCEEDPYEEVKREKRKIARNL